MNIYRDDRLVLEVLAHMMQCLFSVTPVQYISPQVTLIWNSILIFLREKLSLYEQFIEMDTGPTPDRQALDADSDPAK